MVVGVGVLLHVPLRLRNSSRRGGGPRGAVIVRGVLGPVLVVGVGWLAAWVVAGVVLFLLVEAVVLRAARVVGGGVGVEGAVTNGVSVSFTTRFQSRSTVRPQIIANSVSFSASHALKKLLTQPTPAMKNFATIIFFVVFLL